MSTGVAIVALGMAIVFCFIALLALAIHLLSAFKGREVIPSPEMSIETVAAIGAALHAHRSLRKRVERRDLS